ncbi:hypothetical protein BDV35DRAFT_289520 [Aspergillus flavus]|uniref:Mid2 domain-containing protein n=2 Tax=Aspergillus subgen. Circumdati TaxID=2720871 RepID=A0A364LT79_ASPFL|nr:hypothetical protein Ao3042_02306 [Aspergillus oryzae 3.042]KAB8244393.1 hypothetical protein BDV35DRAFT_289520 [Aspergillus flavus]KDE85880.1 hypothetical protein AO1008_02910 [Aspergillus oryzae 100-8]RAQ59113.1 hypothetical protein COH21_005745 [Aspergillus flavus]RAQ76389.1 hypothetical protein COH20_001912 [Aspergillus flavus]|eukprot:EIT81220.1 hypothetical protein Ao3042_02306 [Aspergillus oryzae 3.042]
MNGRRLPGAFLRICLIVLLYGAEIAIAQGDGASNNRFINPPAANSAENPVWVLGEQQVISWMTTWTTFNISIWHQSLGEETAYSLGDIYTQIQDIGVTNFTWKVQTYGAKLEDSPIFFFWINANPTSSGFRLTSNYFNITDKPRATSTSTSFTATSTSESKSTSSSTSTTTSAPSETSATETSQASSSNSGLDPSAKVGLGIGVGIGVPAIALLAVLAYLKYRQSQSRNRSIPAVEPAFAQVPPPWSQPPPRPPPAPKELPGSEVTEWRSELPDRAY